MIGKKKSGFQITSVTSDYDGGSAEGLKEPPDGEAEFGNPLVNGGHPVEPGTPADQTQPPPATTEGATPPLVSGSSGEGVSRGAGAAPEGASSPRTPARAAATPAGGSCTSRFRVVKLGHGLGEPYRRGRWTCLDLYDWDLDSHVLAKVLEGARLVNSLDCHLEVGGLAHKAVSQLRPKAHAPKSQGSPPTPCPPDTPRGKPAAASNTLSMLIQAARTLSLDGAPGLEPPPAPASSSPPSRASPHSPVGRGVATPKESGEGGGALGTTEEAKSGPGQPLGTKPVGGEPAPSMQLSSNVKQPSSSSGEQGAVRKFSEPRSTPVSPAPLTQDGSPSRKSRASEPSIAAGGSLRFTSPMQTLAKSMFSVGTQPDGDDDSGSSSSMVAIDNKIEQAMDLVKSHLMYAVREEVEVLKEQIKDLIDRNSLLERENTLLKSLANPDQLSQLQSQLRSAGSSAGSSGSSNTA